MNCKCQGCNYNNKVMGATIAGCGFFCKAGKLIKKGASILSDLGLLPPGVGILINAGADLMGAGNADTSEPAQAPRNLQRQVNQNISNNRVGPVPTVF